MQVPMIMAAFQIATILLLLFGVVATFRRPPLSLRQSSKITPFPGSSANGSGAALLMRLAVMPTVTRPTTPRILLGPMPLDTALLARVTPALTLATAALTSAARTTDVTQDSTL
jgi:hypothetical protein